ncbi:MAG: hypothetical protein QXT73_08865, partial [Candidatus Methanomethylicaceae archaeon]
SLHLIRYIIAYAVFRVFVIFMIIIIKITHLPHTPLSLLRSFSFLGIIRGKREAPNPTRLGAIGLGA